MSNAPTLPGAGAGGADARIVFSLILALAFVATVTPRGAADDRGLPERLWDAWPASRVIEDPAPCVRPEDLAAAIRGLAARYPGRLRVEDVGHSVRGQPIRLLSLGHGPREVLLWSQMHGDEPSATPALLDVARYLLRSNDDRAVAILDRFTLRMVPMLNPDGAVRYARRNAQAIDINRDALQLASPEGRLLKALRERFSPELGFNLHDRDRRTTVGRTGRLATIALLAVAGDAEGTMSPGRARAKRVCSEIVRALSRFVPGGISRYDEDWNARAFGDNLTAWGTPIVLIESGGPAPGLGYVDLTRLNFVALLTVLSGLERDDLAGSDPALYEALDRNEDHDFVDVLVAGGRVWQPGAGEPYRADVAFDRLDDDPALAGCAPAAPVGPSELREVGDGSLLASATRVDATGRLITPGFAVSVRGLEAREWLDAPDLARLGVARVRWHVDLGSLGEAVAAARSLEGPGRPVLEVVSEPVVSRFLVLEGPPASPYRPDLRAVVGALGGGRATAALAERGLADLLGPLTGAGAGLEAAPPLAPDERADLLVWRPDAPGEREPDALVLERVFVDGRDPAAER